MFFFSYLFLGIILGFLAGDLFHDRRWIFPCIVGAVLPGIADAASGSFQIPATSPGAGFLFPTLIVIIILLAAGLLLWKYASSPVILALDTGICAYQVLSALEVQLVSWSSPLPGTSVVPGPELFNPSEWYLAVLCGCALILFWQQEPLVALAIRYKKVTGLLLEFLVVVLWFLCGIVIACDLLGIPLAYTGQVNPAQFTFVIAAVLLGSILILRWKSALADTYGPHGDPQIASIDQAAGIDLRKLGVAIWDDPTRPPLEAARSIVLELEAIEARTARSGYLLVLVLAWVTVTVTMAGVIVLFLSGKEVPAGMSALGAFAVGFFAGLVVMIEKIMPVW